MLIKSRKYYISYCINLILILFFVNQVKAQPLYQPKLLVYPTINGLTELNVTDTTWLEGNICLEFKIDTINALSIKEFTDRKTFYYKGKIYNKKQLYDLKKYGNIKKLIIKENCIICGGFEPPFFDSKSNCLQNEQKENIMTIYEAYKFWKAKKLKLEFSPYVIDEKGKEFEYDTFGSVIINVDLN